MGFLPPSTNIDYRGSRFSVWFLMLAAVLTIGPGLVHSFLPDGGVTSIAGLHPGPAAAAMVLGDFRWEGATQLALGIAMLVAAWRYRPLTPLFLALLALETGLSALHAWVLTTPIDGHRPPENYGVLVMAPLAVLFCVLAIRAPRVSAPQGVMLEPRR